VLLARLSAASPDGGGQPGPAEQDIGAVFTDRLVAKFGLPVAGWRGQARGRRDTAPGQREEGPSGA
jgi:hypothetical protein